MPQDIHVFVSYKREERHLTEPVLKALQAAGFNAVTDLNIARNTEFGDAIDAMIRAARLTIVLWTKAAARSEWVVKEARLARDLEKAGRENAYLGVMVEDVDLDLPVDLRGLQMLPATDGLNAEAVAQIVAMAKTILTPHVAASPSTSAQVSAALSEEFQLFETAKTIDVKGAYQRYLELYPEGQFARAARRELAMFRWYLHPFRRSNLGHTLTFASILAALGLGAWTINVQQNPPGTVPQSQFNALQRDFASYRSDQEAEDADASAESARLRTLLDAAEGEAKTREVALQEQIDQLIASGEADAAEISELRAEITALSSSSAADAAELAALRAQLAAAAAQDQDEPKELSFRGFPTLFPPPGDCAVSGEAGYQILPDLCVALSATELDLTGTDITSVWVVSFLPELTSLTLRDTAVSDVSSLTRQKNLTLLDLGGTPVDDVRPLARLTNLESLGMWNVDVDDYAPIAGLT